MPARNKTIFNPAIWGPVLLAGLKLLFTRKVPWYSKALVVAALLYAVSPVDVIPDFIFPIVGWADDVAVVLGLLSLALVLIPAGVLKNNPMEKPTAKPTAEPAGADAMDRRVVAVVRATEAGQGEVESATRGR